MIILDTNVISELARAEPARTVLSWVDSQPLAEVGITAVTVAEVIYGVARLPAGRRRQGLAKVVATLITERFDERILPFDVRSAACYVLIVSDRERAGRRIAMADAQIAGICRSVGAMLATRNTRDFIGTGIDLIDPWRAAPK